MFKLKEDKLERLLLELITAIAGVKEYNVGNSGLNWQDDIYREYFEVE